jgi:hypothetical protein
MSHARRRRVCHVGMVGRRLAVSPMACAVAASCELFACAVHLAGDRRTGHRQERSEQQRHQPAPKKPCSKTIHGCLALTWGEPAGGRAARFACAARAGLSRPAASCPGSCQAGAWQPGRRRERQDDEVLVHGRPSSAEPQCERQVSLPATASGARRRRRKSGRPKGLGLEDDVLPEAGGPHASCRGALHSPSAFGLLHHSTFAARRRSALATTLTDDRAIAAAAMTGDRSRPKKGYGTPAASGMPATL